MKIAMIASEANPFIKTGGLGDVAYSLSKELTVMGEEVTLFIPFYSAFRNKLLPNSKLVGRVNVAMSWRRNAANVYRSYCDGITYYFIENSQYFERDGIYGYHDDGERFAFFVMASYEALKLIKFKPDIVHLHDWQSAMFPCYAKTLNDPFYRKTKYVLNIHNPAFKGFMEPSALGNLFNLPFSLFTNGDVRFEDRFSTLKSGITFSDKIIAVSPNHRQELLSEESGMGLSSTLRFREFDFVGILNGIDYSEFDPATDGYISHPYSSTNFVSNKKAVKNEFCKEYDLHIGDKPLFSLVSRLTWQKGIDILLPTIEGLINQGCGIAILGSGEERYQHALQALRDRYPHNIVVYFGYSNRLAHYFYAASDLFFMPSLFEPCGLGQMIAERYGSLPLVRRVGGLKDSVVSYDGNNDDKANGFGFDDYTVDALYNTSAWAVKCYEDKALYKKLVKNAMKTDNSWTKSVKEYLALYKSLKD